MNREEYLERVASGETMGQAQVPVRFRNTAKDRRECGAETQVRMERGRLIRGMSESAASECLTM